jgi:hypothetical protein
MTTTSRPSMPPGCHLHAPSWQPRNAAALATEVEIHHLPIDPARWPAGGPRGRRSVRTSTRSGRLSENRQLTFFGQPAIPSFSVSSR